MTMIRTVNIKLNKFPVIPNTLRGKSTLNNGIIIADDVPINLANLYHHYYLDNYGLIPPNPDYKNFEHLNFLTSDKDFRIEPENGIGISTAAKRNKSYELGQAFARLFLYNNLGIVYFAHMDKIINNQVHRGFGGIKIRRILSGDVPDYLCARDVGKKIYIGEAKGRYTSFDFSTQEFSHWRKQFDRIEVLDKNGNLLSIKGYIVATRFVTKNKKRIKTTIYAEDPKTKGNIDINDSNNNLSSVIISEHYSNILGKLRLPVLAKELSN